MIISQSFFINIIRLRRKGRIVSHISYFLFLSAIRCTLNANSHQTKKFNAPLFTYLLSTNSKLDVRSWTFEVNLLSAFVAKKPRSSTYSSSTYSTSTYLRKWYYRTPMYGRFLCSKSANFSHFLPFFRYFSHFFDTFQTFLNVFKRF